MARAADVPADDDAGDPAPRALRRRRGPTRTSNFGVGRRENHDATAFYDRFTPPELSADSEVARPAFVDRIVEGSGAAMTGVVDGSVALVVTSPPYFAGKQYEEELGAGGVPASYAEYLAMLEAVFAECARVLEPGGRIAVNVANLGRKPYRSLSADVTDILQRLGLLLRGEIIWHKSEGMSGSCAWGSFQSPANPVLRDLTERIVVASKGRFDRAGSRSARERAGLPYVATISRDHFMAWTTDVWDFPPESATRVGHPAPFPVELPQRLIELYTYRDDVVLDPFMGSGSTAVAALETRRHYVGYDTDPAYVARARERVADTIEALEASADTRHARRIERPAVETSPDDENPQARAVREGAQAKEIARIVLEECGFALEDDGKPRRLRSGVQVDFAVVDALGAGWYVDVSGSFTGVRSGLRRTDTVWKALGRAAIVDGDTARRPLLLLTTDLPPRGSAGAKALAAAQRSGVIVDAVEMLSDDGQAQLRGYAQHGAPSSPRAASGAE